MRILSSMIHYTLLNLFFAVFAATLSVTQALPLPATGQHDTPEPTVAPYVFPSTRILRRGDRPVTSRFREEMDKSGTPEDIKMVHDNDKKDKAMRKQAEDAKKKAEEEKQHAEAKKKTEEEKQHAEAKKKTEEDSKQHAEFKANKNAEAALTRETKQKTQEGKLPQEPQQGLGRSKVNKKRTNRISATV